MINPYNYGQDDGQEQEQTPMSSFINMLAAMQANQPQRPLSEDLGGYGGIAEQYAPRAKPTDYAKTPVTDLMSTIRKRESGGNYKIRNSLGYSGAYQFGPSALETVGYLKKGAGKGGMKALDDPNNWTIKGGMQAFMNTPQLQDEAMRKLMASNQQQLTRMGLISRSTPQRDIDGMLAAAHLSGVGGVKKMLAGKANARDAYGTSARDYYQMGRGGS